MVDDRPDGPPDIVVFLLPTAQRVGAQPRHAGGRNLDEVRTAARLLLGPATAEVFPPGSEPGNS